MPGDTPASAGTLEPVIKDELKTKIAALREEWMKHDNFDTIAKKLMTYNDAYIQKVEEMDRVLRSIPVVTQDSAKELQDEAEQKIGFLSQTFVQLTDTLDSQQQLENTILEKVTKVHTVNLSTLEMSAVQITAIRSDVVESFGLCAFGNGFVIYPRLKQRLTNFLRLLYEYLCSKEELLVPVLLKVTAEELL
eukprot:GFYU01020641.1.p1 GENE.GFYU01020641.1~~GFYU01020641.1.p1  ORF type:complete len:192 (-),score=69.41 GFYU01020641.1:291-866(-)